MKNYTVIGLAVGLAVAALVTYGGFPAFLWALLFAGLGGLFGAHFDGKIDLASLLSGNGLNGRG